MRALVFAGGNVPKHRSETLVSLHVYLPTLFLSLEPWRSCALSGSIEVNKIKLKSAKNMKFAIAVLLFSVIDVKLQLKSVYNTTIIQKSSKESFVHCTNQIARFFIIYFKNAQRKGGLIWKRSLINVTRNSSKGSWIRRVNNNWN